MVVVSLLCTSSSSHSLAAALPFTPPPHPPPVLAMLRTLVVVLALAVVAFAQSSGSFTNTFYLSGGVPFCTQCGAQGQYACSSGGVGNWQSNFMVRDPVAPGSAVSGIEVALIGTAPNSLTPSRIHAIGSRSYSLTRFSLSLCGAGSFACTWTPSVLAVTINGVPVNTLQSGGSNACQCNTCDGSLVYSITFPSFNLPYYSYGGSNNITINVLSGSVCLNAVNITTSWAPPRTSRATFLLLLLLSCGC